MESLQSLRQHALEAFHRAVDAVQPKNLLAHAVEGLGDSIDVPARLVVAALGKAAPGLASAWLESSARRPDELIVIAPRGVSIPPKVTQAARLYRGSHPVPDCAGAEATEILMQLAHGLGRNDLLILLLSGGASALLARPAEGISLEDLRRTTQMLLDAGTPIQALNTVRRELQIAAGGGLAAATFPARVLTLVLSDVVNGSLADIGSGPTVPSPTNPTHALEVLHRLELAHKVPPSIPAFLRGRLARISHQSSTAAGDALCPAAFSRIGMLDGLSSTTPRPSGRKPHWAHHLTALATNLGEKSGLERPAASPVWATRTRTVLLGDNATAVMAASCHLEVLGYGVWTPSRPLTGEAAQRGRQLGALAKSIRNHAPTAMVFGGETTVTVHGSGRGGRNTELALAAAIEIQGAKRCVILAAGTDGIDGSCLHAGGLVDPTSFSRVKTAGIDPQSALADNDSATALAASGDTITTGPTGTNVADLVMILKPPTL